MRLMIVIVCMLVLSACSTVKYKDIEYASVNRSENMLVHMIEPRKSGEFTVRGCILNVRDKWECHNGIIEVKQGREVSVIFYAAVGGQLAAKVLKRGQELEVAFGTYDGSVWDLLEDRPYLGCRQRLDFTELSGSTRTERCYASYKRYSEIESDTAIVR